jgi:hypothetical protein
MESLVVWILAAMATAWSLTSKLPGPVPKDIAQSIAKYALKKPIFKGESGARKTAALVIGTARYESGFRQVAGDCKGLQPGDPRCGKDGTTPSSFCYLQVFLPDGQKTKQGWTGDDLMKDIDKCTEAGIEIMRDSVSASPRDENGDATEPLKNYAGDSAKGMTRFRLAKKLIAEVPYNIRCD